MELVSATMGSTASRARKISDRVAHTTVVVMANASTTSARVIWAGAVILVKPRCSVQTAVLLMADAGMGNATVTPDTRAKLATRSKPALKDV